MKAMKRAVPGSASSIMRGEGRIPVPAHLVFELVRDTSRKGEWDKMFAAGTELEQLDDNSGK